MILIQTSCDQINEFFRQSFSFCSGERNEAQIDGLIVNWFRMTQLD